MTQPVNPHYLQLFFFSILLGLSVGAKAQYGDFILTHHAPRHSEIDNINFHLESDKNGVLCIANRLGVLKYDGIDWDFYPTQSSAISLSISDDNIVYVGCIGEFGKLDIQDNKYGYIPLISDDSIDDHFLQTFVIDDMVYFLSERNIYGYNEDRHEIAHLATGNHLNGYVYNGQLWVNNDDETLLSINGFEVTQATPGAVEWGLISASPSGINTLGITLSGELYRITDSEAKPIPQNEKIKEAGVTITDLGWVNDTLVAISTVESGVFFINTNNPKYFEVTDYHSGLPDNEIFDLFTDNDAGVWVAHEFGLTRISPLYPAHSYSNYPGIAGNLIEAQRIKGDLWVNSSLGVYYFSQDTSFQSKVFREKVVTKIPSKSSQRSAQKTTTRKDEQTEEEAEDDDKNKRGFLKGLLKKKVRSESTEKPEEEKGFFKNLFSSKQESEKIEYVRRVEKIFTGISYQFHHVPGTDGKFKQLLNYNDIILATSHAGVFEITKKSAQLVINEPIRYAYPLLAEDKILVSTDQGYLKLYAHNKGIWTEQSREYFKDVILNVYRDKKGTIWLAGTSHIYNGQLLEDRFQILHTYEINNRFYDELSIWERQDRLYFINTQGYYYFDEASDRIIRDVELAEEIGLPHHHIQNENSRVWLYNGKIWYLLQPDSSIERFDYLGVYPDLKYISYDPILNRYWLVTQDNQLLAYTSAEVPDLHLNNRLFVKRLRGRNGEIKIVDGLRLSHDQNYLSIELLKPDYLGLLNPEYQYRLEGLNDEWSSWTKANLIDYSFLPPGDYKLLVRVRDSFGQIEEAEVLNFTIATPYWQQPWFYALQVFILASIIAVTSRLNEEKVSNRLIKHGLSILTLVAIIEFLQSILAAYFNISSSPVIDFLVDVGTAIMVFPLEWVLRKLMLEGGFHFMKKKKNKGTEDKKSSS
jgi:hypothetical protein